MSSISRWPRASRHASHSRTCVSLPRMMSLRPATALSTSCCSVGSAPVTSAVDISAARRGRCDRREAPPLLAELRELPLELRDALAFLLHDALGCIRDEVHVRELGRGAVALL